MLADDNKWREASVADNHDIFALVKRRRARIASGYGGNGKMKMNLRVQPCRLY